MALNFYSREWVCSGPGEFWKACSIAFLCMLTSSMAFGQATVHRDQQALTILAQAISAGGGQDLLGSIQDFTESGTATFGFDKAMSIPITVKDRGLRQFRMDADLPEGRRSTVISAAGGSVKEANGQFRPISPQIADDLRSITLPYPTILAMIQDSSIDITYSGLVSHNGATVYDIRAAKTYTFRQDPTGLRGPSEARDFYIDPKTFLVSTISDRFHFGTPAGHGAPHEIIYSNYQTQNGIVAPFTIVETIRGVPGSTVQLTQVAFNTGLTDSDFTD